MSVELDALTAAVTKISAADDSIIALCQGLAQQLKDLVSNNLEFAALKAAVLDRANELEAKANEVAAAVVANTPAG